jgi:hypothetical protein
VKAVIFVAAGVLLCGCETGDGWVPGENPGTESVAIPHTAPVVARVAPPVVVASVPLAAPAPVVAARPVVVATPVVAPQPAASPAFETADAARPSPYDEHCKAVAHQRAADARANGYSFGMADAVYDGTYKDCVVWDTQHGSSVSR